MAKKIIKGCRIKTSGLGRTAKWMTRKGTVLKRSGDKVFVKWDGLHLEDEMTISEVKML
jgi:hypothetical protein